MAGFRSGRRAAARVSRRLPEVCHHGGQKAAGFSARHRAVIEGEPAQLLESLAQRIADYALQDEKVVSAWVRIRKPHIALPGALGGSCGRGRWGEGDDRTAGRQNGRRPRDPCRMLPTAG